MSYKLQKKNPNHSNGEGYITKDGHTMLQQDIVRDLERAAAAQTNDASLRMALSDAMQSLRTIAESRGSEYLDDMLSLRGFANSRAIAAADAIAGTRPA